MERRGRFSDLARAPTSEKEKARVPSLKTHAQPKVGNSILPAKVLGVSLREGFPLFWQIIQRENRRYRADGNTGSAINTLNRVDVQHFLFRKRRRILLRMNAIHRAGIHTCGVLSAYARLCNYVCHKVCIS